MDNGGGRLSRRGSSFLGSIKSFVAKPLAWIARDNADVGDKRTGDVLLDNVDPQPASKRPRRSSPPRRPQNLPRASSAVLPSRSRNALSPRRPQQMTRTMSIDPPIDPLRDSSIPLSPLSPQHSFRVRSSLTPQPPLPPNRHLSEPPPLNSLITNPVFLHPPPQPARPAHEPHTLGTLASTVRATRSPARVVSLLFEPPATIPEHERVDAPAERALHQLDVYKTPLVPTRMRTSGPPATGQGSDMFKSRRASNLVLMKDDPEKDKQAESKPYAGRGGMKKLLARRRLELDDDERLKEQDVQTEDIDIERPDPVPAPPPPPEPANDWFAVASSSAPLASSSLRVGRTKTSRNHIPRPAKKKFSAAFDVDADEPMDDDDKRERDALNEAAKKAPAFTLPSDFSFAKEAPAPPINPADLEKAKEPPIVSLPFSFAKPQAAPTPPKPAPVTLSLPAPAPPPVEPKPPVSVSIFAQPSAPAPSPPVPTTSAGVPNFFASSKLLSKPPELKVPSIAGFAAAAKASSTPSFSFGVTPPTPSQQPGNLNETDKPASDLPPVSLFGTTPAKPPAPTPAAEATPIPAAAPFSFGKLAEAAPAPAPVPAPSQPFSFGAPAKAEETPKQSEQPKSLFGAPAQPSFAPAVPPASTPSPSPFTFGAPPTPAAPAAEAPKPFTFGAPEPSQAPKVDVPKPLFGGTSTPFTFGQDNKEKKEEPKPASSPFTFGAPANPPAAPEPPKAASPFTFGAPATSSPAPTGFSFGGGTNAADVSVKPPFAFGAPTPVERPVTPPKNVDNEIRMEESPVRETTQQNKPAMTGFSFGAPPGASAPSFGAGPSSISTSSPFSFGAGAPASNPFAQKEAPKPAENNPFTFGAPSGPPTAPPITTSFSFGKPAEEQRPSSGGGFTFGVTTPTPTSTTAPTSAFNFGAPASNPFAQAGSAPSSPSTFNQSSPFAFGSAPLPPAGGLTPTTVPVNNPFGFGSQPASPAAGAPISLPPPAFGASTPQPGSPFSAPAPLAPSTSGGGTPLFTMGAAPSAPAGGARVMRKLPNRRTTTKR